ncbi:hypothetical protein Hanom_Chr04g00328351 [Helianthus anomalus]
MSAPTDLGPNVVRELKKKGASKRSWAKGEIDPSPAAKKVTFGKVPTIGNNGNLLSLMTKISPGTSPMQPRFRFVHSKDPKADDVPPPPPPPSMQLKYKHIGEES